jgi:hypothetical protein
VGKSVGLSPDKKEMVCAGDEVGGRGGGGGHGPPGADVAAGRGARQGGRRARRLPIRQRVRTLAHSRLCEHTILFYFSHLCFSSISLFHLFLTECALKFVHGDRFLRFLIHFTCSALPQSLHLRIRSFIS